jgi:hypothetical protein
MATHLGLHFYARRNGVNIPLIPADQLPFGIDGLSCPLSDLQISMQDWRLVGETKYPPLPLIPRQLVQQANSGSVPFPEKRKYCKYWIEHGSCGFGEGCRHLHEMPDRAKLRHLGFADYPQWYKIENPKSCEVKPAKKAAPTTNKANTNKKMSIKKDTPIEMETPVRKKMPTENENAVEKGKPIKKVGPITKKKRRSRDASKKNASTTHSPNLIDL